jgi:nucleoid-associated protein YgaU
MFTAMLSRPYLLVLFLGFMLAFGAGWAVYELSFDQSAGAPTATTDPAAPEQMAGDGKEPAGPAEQAPAAPPEVASPADRRASEPPQSASPAERPQATQSSGAEVAGLKARVERLKAEIEGSEPVATAPGEAVQTDEPEPDLRAEAPPPSDEPESSSAGTAANTASAPTSSRPPVAASVAEPRTSQDETRSTATPGGSTAAEKSPSPVPAPSSGGAPPKPAPGRDMAGEALPDPSTSIQSAAPPSQLESPSQMAHEPKAPSRVAEEDEVALADPARPSEELAPRPSPETATAANPAPAVSDESATGATPAPRDETDVSEEPVPRASRLAETIRRAVAALFGGAMDEPATGAGESEVAAVPEAAPTAPAPDPGDPADVEPGAAPSFDIVRVEPAGRAVVAGRAAPGAEVELRIGDRVIDRVRADRRGEWVAIPPEPLAAGVQELSLAARVEDQPAVESEEVVVVAVPGQPAQQPASRAAAEPPSPQPAEVGAAGPADQAFAVALPREGTGKGRILQAPGRISTDGALALVMLDYDDAGRIRLSGEASAGAALRIYVDNQPAGTTVVGPTGQWDAVLERTLTPGDYMLRLDQLGASGKPDARLETPFTRVSHPPVEGDVQVDYVIVQPGNSLWRIARRVLGEGMHYVHIYEANHPQIRDPDLIYPGQVFEVPSGIGRAG